MTPTLLGALVAALAGFTMGSGVWPMKVLRRFAFENWMFISMSVGLVIVPWSITLIGCPNAIDAYRSVGLFTLVKSNLFALGWGIANLLGSLCFTRIGVSLTGGIMAGLGVSVGVAVPMVVKGSGLFHSAPDLASTAGYTALFGVAVMLVGVVFVAKAGFGRDRILKIHQNKPGGFGMWLILGITAGILSCGTSFAFVYCQEPIIHAMKAHGAGDIPSIFAVWAVGLLSGTVVNIGVPAYLMTKNKSWHTLIECPRDIVLAAIIGLMFCTAIALMGKGMLILGALGGSIGWGIYNAMQMMGAQGVGFMSGEWHGVHGGPRTQMVFAIIILIAASTVLAYGNFLAGR